jgi:ribosome-binding factor A
MHSGGKGRRTLRVANLIREVVSEVLIREINDPRVSFVTVTGVDVSEDMRFADVRVSVMGDKKQQDECLRGIRHAHGYVQERVADAVKMRYCPVLRFHLDQSVKRSIAISQLIAQARAEDEAARADRIRRGVEEPGPAPEFEEAEPQAEPAEDPGGNVDEEK